MDKNLWHTFLGHPVCAELADGHFDLLGLVRRKSIHFEKDIREKRFRHFWFQ